MGKHLKLVICADMVLAITLSYPDRQIEKLSPNFIARIENEATIFMCDLAFIWSSSYVEYTCSGDKAVA